MSCIEPGDGDARHGSPNGYGNLGCRCLACTTAHTEDCRDQKASRMARLAEAQVEHGRPNTYGNWGCRCGPCTTAWSSADAARRVNRRARSTKLSIEPLVRWCGGVGELCRRARADRHDVVTWRRVGVGFTRAAQLAAAVGADTAQLWPESALEADVPGRLNTVIAACSTYLAIPMTDLVGPGRQHYLIEARHLTMAACRRLVPLASYPLIGRAFDRDHTTVMYAVTKVANSPELLSQLLVLIGVLTDASSSQCRLIVTGPDGSQVLSAVVESPDQVSAIVGVMAAQWSGMEWHTQPLIRGIG